MTLQAMDRGRLSGQWEQIIRSLMVMRGELQFGIPVGGGQCMVASMPGLWVAEGGRIGWA